MRVSSSSKLLQNHSHFLYVIIILVKYVFAIWYWYWQNLSFLTLIGNILLLKYFGRFFVLYFSQIGVSRTRYLSRYRCTSKTVTMLNLWNSIFGRSSTSHFLTDPTLHLLRSMKSETLKNSVGPILRKHKWYLQIWLIVLQPIISNDILS